MRQNKKIMHRKGFTLLELLIVIAILAVLATVAVLVINPLEYIKQSRDAKRIGDMEALNKALGLADFEGISLGGASTTVFVSLVDTVATCANLELPSLPTGYQYQCVTVTANLDKVDGTGWIPVNFNNLSSKAPLAVLPNDPINTVANFYTYIPGGSFALSATLESEKYLKQNALKDGGTNPGKIEMGSDLKLLTKADGLVGYWPFDEGSGMVILDASGNNSKGTSVNGPSYVAGKIGSALSFDGIDDSVNIPYQPNFRNAVTVSIWIKRTTAYNQMADVFIVSPPSAWYFYDSYNSGSIHGDVYIGGTRKGAVDVPVPFDGNWYYIVYTYDSATHFSQIYKNGVLAQSVEVTGLGSYLIDPAIGNLVNMGYQTLGRGIILDDVRVYNRPLTASEVQSIYNATK